MCNGSLDSGMDVMPRLSGSLFDGDGGCIAVSKILSVLVEERGEEGKVGGVVPSVRQVQTADIGNQAPSVKGQF